MSTNPDQKKKRPKIEDNNDYSTPTATDLTQRRFLRSGYLSIQNLIRDKKDEISKVDSEKFKSIMNEVDGMHDQVRKPREQVSDAEALRDLTNSLVTSIRLHSTGNVTPSMFVSSLISEFGKKRKMGTNERVELCWKDLGLHVSPLFRICRGAPTMIGPMSLEPKLRKVSTARKRRRSVKVEKVKPEELEDAVSKQKTETEKIIATLFDILKVHKKVLLENLVFNRISFAQTVENLFALSFLAKDGRVLIEVEKNGSHYVSPRNAPSASMIASKTVVYSHFIFRFDFNDWKLMMNQVGKGCELMPHRMKLNHSGDSQSEPHLNTNTNPTTRTTMKTPSRTAVESDGSAETGGIDLNN